MAKEDLLTKQINQLGFVLKKMLEQLVGGKSGADFTEVIGAINVKMKEEMGFDLDTIEGLNPEEILGVLLKQPHFDMENLERFADILAQIPQTHFYEKALFLYHHINKTTATFSIERNAKIETLRKYFL